LCSVTFRNRRAPEIIGLCRTLGVTAVEWGGDVHVPHGDFAAARAVSGACRENGIDCPSYGSYYRAGVSGGQGLSFETVLETAAVLGCRTVRVWAGDRNYEEYGDQAFQQVVADTRRIASLAEARGLTVSFEYHDNTLTRKPESLERFDRAVSHSNVRYYWQPPHGFNDRECLDSLTALGSRLTNLHVFHWNLTGRDGPDRYDRRPFAEGCGRWKPFLSAASLVPCLPESRDDRRFAFMEFVRGDAPERFEQDWRDLKDLLEGLC